MMKKIILLLISLASCFIASANKRGVSFEHNGLIYTIASEFVVRKRVVGRTILDSEYEIIKEGEVYVSGVTASNKDVKIPSFFYYPLIEVKKDSTTCLKPAKGATKYTVLGIGEKAFEGATLKSLVIPHGLRFIGNEAFRDMTITKGILVVPPARRMNANVFIGLKSKVFLPELEDEYNSNTTPILFNKTFDIKEGLPEIYVRHNAFGKPIESLDRRILYTVGDSLTKEWYNYYSSISYRPKPITSYGKFGFYTFNTFSGAKTPTITIRPAKKFEKTRTDLDMIAPYEFVCWNPYTQKREVCSDFVMNESIYRLKKEENYLYYTVDGKPITNIDPLIDASGKDPFGLQVRDLEEIKAKNAANERSNNLNNKIELLKSTLGF